MLRRYLTSRLLGYYMLNSTLGRKPVHAMMAEIEQGTGHHRVVVEYRPWGKKKKRPACSVPSRRRVLPNGPRSALPTLRRRELSHRAPAKTANSDPTTLAMPSSIMRCPLPDFTDFPADAHGDI